MANYLISNPIKPALTSLFSFAHNACRFGHTLRGKPPGIARSLIQRLTEDSYTDPEICRQIDIGLPFPRPSRSAELKKRLEHVREQKKNAMLEKKSREQTLQIDLNQMQVDWMSTTAPHQICKLAQHYGIYKHLFGDAYFKPRVELNIKFQIESSLHRVYYGNMLTPSETKTEPSVSFLTDPISNGQSKTLWTLIMTNPDGNYDDGNKEVIHWLISNIPDNNVSKGQLLVPFLQPIPPKGVGFQRFVFVLFKQEKSLDLSKFKVNDKYNLEQRSFSTLEFYRQYQDDMTPASLAFFQSSWDKSITDFYHQVLDRKEPTFEYDFPAPYIKEQKWFPLKEPFNLYMDKYRDPKQVNKEYLIKKLAKTHPFHGPESELKFPNAHAIDKKVPSWIATEIRKDRLKWGRINDY